MSTRSQLALTIVILLPLQSACSRAPEVAKADEAELTAEKASLEKQALELERQRLALERDRQEMQKNAQAANKTESSVQTAEKAEPTPQVEWKKMLAKFQNYWEKEAATKFRLADYSQSCRTEFPITAKLNYRMEWRNPKPDDHAIVYAWRFEWEGNRWRLAEMTWAIPTLGAPPRIVRDGNSKLVTPIFGPL
jgi:hypothetical protein